jgi:ribosomal protein S18 acetylase RimI-like enzyme
VPDSLIDRMLESTAQRTETWKHWLSLPAESGYRAWVAADGIDIVGFATVGRDRDGNPNTGELYSIYLLPSHWDAGVGRALLNEAVSSMDSQNYASAVLWVLDNNARARRFYEKAGWSADGGTKLDDRVGGVVLNEVRYRLALR